MTTINGTLQNLAILNMAHQSAVTGSQPGPVPVPGDDAITDSVQGMYIAFYGRPADPNGLTYWVDQIKYGGQSTSSVVNAFAASAEATALYNGTDAASQLNKIYLQLFNRSPDAAGLQYWTDQIINGKVTLANAAYSILNGARGGDQTILNHKLVVANIFDVQLSNTVQLAVYTGNTSASNGHLYLSFVGSDTVQAAKLAGVADSVAMHIQFDITADLAAAGIDLNTVTLTTGISPASDHVLFG